MPVCDFIEFLTNFSIREIIGPKDGKIHWQADEKDSHYRSTGLTREAVIWELKRAWASRYARTYPDEKGRWWVGEKGSHKGFTTEIKAREYRDKLIKKYGAN